MNSNDDDDSDDGDEILACKSSFIFCASSRLKAYTLYFLNFLFFKLIYFVQHGLHFQCTNDK